MRVLLVARPWRGGLAWYVREALERTSPGRVQWFPTQPETAWERMRYRRDRRAWRGGLVERINAARYDLGIFIGAVPGFDGLERRDCNVLWLVDDPRPLLAHAGAFPSLYISDPGYEDAVRRSSRAREFAGVLPFAHLPRVHRAVAGVHSRCGVCFIGNRDPNRDAPLERLVGTGMPVHVYGNHFLRHRAFWRHPLRFRPRVSIQSMGEVYARHAVSLNIHAQVVRGGTNMRTFECAGYGIPQVVEHRPGLDELFEPEQEILVYRDLDEMVGQVERLLHDPAEAAAMAGRAQRRARAKHTYEHRVRAIMQRLDM